MAFANAWSSDVPAKETKGGTGNSSYAIGDMLYAGSANNLDKLAVGANNLVVTSNGTIPTWSAASSSGSLIFLTSQTAAASATLDFVSVLDATYRCYFYIATMIVPVSDANTFVTEYSTDNGATWETTDYSHYTETFRFTTGATASTFGSSQAYNRITPTSTVSNTAGDGLNFEGWIWAPDAGTTNYTRMTWEGNYKDSASGSILDLRGSGTRTDIANVTAIRFKFVSGNVSSGKISIYGLQNS